MREGLAGLVVASALLMGSSLRGGERAADFARDPEWEGHQNRVVPDSVVTVKQAFGYSPTHFAGKERGEIGGVVWRSSTPASYAAAIEKRTLDDKLSASGAFAISETRGSSGAYFGWFNSTETGAGRQSTLGFRFAGEGSGARLTVQLVTAKNQACGTKITPWVVDRDKPRGPGRKFKPTSIKNDGTRYTWEMSYDPAANNGDGQIAFVLRSNSAEKEEFEGKPFTIDLPKGYKQHGTSFDRFGLMNSMRGGNPMTVHFDDLQIDGRAEDFAKEPEWIGAGNDASFEDRERGGLHDFGFSGDTNFAGGAAAGEIGGMLWRSGDFGYYADRVGRLTLNDRLEARGKVILQIGAPDSGMCIGWFNSEDTENAPTQSGDFLGVKIGGPTRVGHYFVPAYATSNDDPVERGDKQHPPNIHIERSTGPVLTPRRVFDWKIVYDPAANNGSGAIEATLGNESIALPLKPGHKAKGAAFDRFGLFTARRGGSYVKIYFDDLSYTAAPTDE